MSNTYAINTTRNREFEVERELIGLGLHPWVPKYLASKYVKEKRETVWYDKPYVSKLMFCVIPAIYWPEVVGLKHVIGKPLELSRRDIDGSCYGVSGLLQFKACVEAEYADRERLKANSEYQCQYQPGQALELLEGSFRGLEAVFKETIKRAHDDYHKIRVEIDILGRQTLLEVDPDKVSIA